MKFAGKISWLFFTLLLFLIAGGLLVAGEVDSRSGRVSTPQQVTKKEQTTVEQKKVSTPAKSAAKNVLPQEVKLSAPFTSQKPELPNGCEITSLTMLLNSAGVPVDKMTLAAKVKKVPFSSGGYQGNPNIGFVGNMYHGDTDDPGLAVYHGPIVDLARQYLGGRVMDLSGDGWDQVEQRLASGTPVWVIVSINFQPVPEGDWQTWHTQQGDMRISFMEHSVLVTGYDKDNVYFNDPEMSSGGSKADKSDFVEAWEQFGSQAVTYTK
ncbi:MULTISPECIES: C39 family peptidase [unclassified Sporolactobacillus]|uniref:C39 family peptidase n=1 Tax=unclassified Sporolactobacillus TaxID=2628533 RepID=UPI002368C5F2|nr:C39 family peptidase [Sporolactobacillus sp. CQH2019]MDD9150069.1 C39 family peptidase [Sporolactobacillus sp. CQH2019]